MKDNTVTTVDGVEVYTSQIAEIADRYIDDLEDIDSIYTYEVFTDLTSIAGLPECNTEGE